MTSDRSRLSDHAIAYGYGSQNSKLYISRLGIIIKINAITDIPGGIGSSKASHVLILSKKPLRLFSVCNRKLSSLEEKQLLISLRGAHRETVLEGCANSFNIINNFSLSCGRSFALAWNFHSGPRDNCFIC